MLLPVLGSVIDIFKVFETCFSVLNSRCPLAVHLHQSCNIKRCRNKLYRKTYPLHLYLMSSSAYSRAQISINSYHIVAYAPLTEAKRMSERLSDWCKIQFHTFI